MRPAISAALPSDDNEVNLTPMLDVVFILLIFFIVTASFVKEHGLDVNRPGNQQKTLTAGENILVAISASDEIWIDRRLIEPRALRANLARLRAENPQAAVVIQADRKSTSNALVQVMDTSRQVGLHGISIAEN